jgi:hypothetical protein
VTVILVVQTLRVTRAEAEKTREQLNEQLDLLRRQQVLEEMHKRLDGCLAAWQEMMNRPAAGLARAEGDALRESAEGRTLQSVLNDPDFYPEVVTIMADNRRNAARANWIFPCFDATRLLRELSKYCREYDATAGNHLLTDFYRLRVYRAARVLCAMDFLSQATLESLSADEPGD